MGKKDGRVSSWQGGKGGRGMRWQSGNSGRVVRWQDEKGGKVVSQEGGKYLILFKDGGRRVQDFIFLLLMLMKGTKGQNGLKIFLLRSRNGKTPNIFCKLLKI